jgi:uncharacterized alkaline shock family protein YloU
MSVEEVTQNSLGGTINIAKDAVATIVRLITLETPGVVGMSGGITEGLGARLTGKNSNKGIQVEVGQTEAAVDLRIIVKYGIPIHQVCRTLQENIHETVESSTGLKVVAVNVKVESVSFKEEELEEVQVGRVR